LYFSGFVAFLILSAILGIVLGILLPPKDSSLYKEGDVKKIRINTQSCVEMNNPNTTYCSKSEANMTVYVSQTNKTHANAYVSVDNMTIPEHDEIKDTNAKPEEFE
jgi:hypothetical protein